MEENKKNFDLKAELKSLGMTQKDFAEHIDRTTSTINRWAIGEIEIPIKLIKLVTSENAITLFYLDKLTQKLNLKSPVDFLEIDLNSFYFIPTELGKFFNKSAVDLGLNKDKHRGLSLRM